MLHQQTA
jgi:hypothetical protein